MTPRTWQKWGIKNFRIFKCDYYLYWSMYVGAEVRLNIQCIVNKLRRVAVRGSTQRGTQMWHVPAHSRCPLSTTPPPPHLTSADSCAAPGTAQSLPQHRWHNPCSIQLSAEAGRGRGGGGVAGSNTHSKLIAESIKKGHQVYEEILGIIADRASIRRADILAKTEKQVLGTVHFWSNNQLRFEI